MDSNEVTNTVLVPTGRGMNVGTGNPVTSTVRVTLERERFESHFRCSKCGHTWSEKSTVVRKA